MRWFLLSLILWGLKALARTPSLPPSAVPFWMANVVVAVLFGVSHLGVAKLGMEITPFVLGTLLVANGILSLLFGWLGWRRGIEAAMLPHFSADLVLHVVGPMFG